MRTDYYTDRVYCDGDSYITTQFYPSWAPVQNYGICSLLVVGRDTYYQSGGGPDIEFVKYGYMKFPIEAYLETHPLINITNAKLYVNVQNAQFWWDGHIIDGSTQITINRLTSSWVEGTKCSAGRATVDELCYLNRPSVINESIGSFSTSPPYGWYSVDITRYIRDIDYGVRLVHTGGGSSGSDFVSTNIRSREAGFPAYIDITYVVYTPEEGDVRPYDFKAEPYGDDVLLTWKTSAYIPGIDYTIGKYNDSLGEYEFLLATEALSAIDTDIPSDGLYKYMLVAEYGVRTAEDTVIDYSWNFNCDGTYGSNRQPIEKIESPTDPCGGWVESQTYVFDQPYIVKSMDVYFKTKSMDYIQESTVLVQLSDDGTAWTTVYTVDIQTTNVYKHFTITVSDIKEYSFFRFYVLNDKLTVHNLFMDGSYGSVEVRYTATEWTGEVVNPPALFAEVYMYTDDDAQIELSNYAGAGAMSHTVHTRHSTRDNIENRTSIRMWKIAPDATEISSENDVILTNDGKVFFKTIEAKTTTEILGTDDLRWLEVHSEELRTDESKTARMKLWNGK